jgi:hypothetical protein
MNDYMTLDLQAKIQEKLKEYGPEQRKAIQVNEFMFELDYKPILDISYDSCVVYKSALVYCNKTGKPTEQQFWNTLSREKKRITAVPDLLQGITNQFTVEEFDQTVFQKFNV